MSSLSTTADSLVPPAYSPPAAAPAFARDLAEGALAFLLFLVVNATLFVRPAEVVEWLIGWPIYQVLILSCLALALSCVLDQLAPANLAKTPITVCVILFLPLVFLSHVANGALENAFVSGFEFFKVVVYYLLFVGLVNSPRRLQRFLFWFTIFAVVLVCLAVLVYHGVVTLPNLTPVKDRMREEDMGYLVFYRLRGSGIFQDPNELCLILVFGMALSLYWAGERRLSGLRFLWLLPLVFFAYALNLTQSRGGLLALLVAMLTFGYYRFGKGKTILLAVVAAPVLALLVGGRQASISMTETTAQSRVMLWSDGLDLFRACPIFGIGFDEYRFNAGQVGHNSFLHCFTELGFLAGILFLGAFYYCFRELNRFSAPGLVFRDPAMRRLHPYLTAALAGYTAGMFTISYSYAVPTYTVLGLATAYVRVTAVRPRLVQTKFDMQLCKRFVALGVLFLVSMYVFVRLSK